MPTVFKHSLVTEVGTTPTEIVEIGAGVRATVIGCNLANRTEYDTVIADVLVVGADTTVSYYVKGLIIPPNTSVKVVTQGEKIILPELTGLRLVTDTENSVDATVSYVEIS
jgi:hypothetical protein